MKEFKDYLEEGSKKQESCGCEVCKCGTQKECNKHCGTLGDCMDCNCAGK